MASRRAQEVFRSWACPTRSRRGALLHHRAARPRQGGRSSPGSDASSTALPSKHTGAQPNRSRRLEAPGDAARRGAAEVLWHMRSALLRPRHQLLEVQGARGRATGATGCADCGEARTPRARPEPWRAVAVRRFHQRQTVYVRPRQPRCRYCDRKLTSGEAEGLSAGETGECNACRRAAHKDKHVDRAWRASEPVKGG
jgi:hypothetical protein